MTPGPATRLAMGAIRLYQITLSPLFAGSCRFEPSCSRYAMGALEQHGLRRGAWLALRRLARCHPLGGSGLDPVPPRPR
ncbi:MAG TPA: membrane protein insertion efficiency factor YidD [Luteitalea sp.]|nr:membrane protein insertion efficiency factor YidD [Luteitalea sp.]